MGISFTDEQNRGLMLQKAMKSGDEAEIAKAWQGFFDDIVQEVRADFEAVQNSNDAAVMAQRGFRQLTSRETKWYQKIANALKSRNYKQEFATIIGSEQEDDLMPETIIEDVYKDLVDAHPLLNVIGVQYVGYATKWILNDHSVQTAAWGEINSEITEEITSAFRVIDITQNKLSAFMCIPRDMLDLGPVFLDAYMRRCLLEALSCGLEEGIVNGTGLNMPIGLTRDIHTGVNFSTTEGYPLKTKIAVTDFTPKTYGGLVAQLAKNERGKMRRIAGVAMLVNPVDYYNKIVPATTVMGADGLYRGNIMPVPTTFIQTTALKEGEAVMFLPAEYKLLAGGRKNGVIEQSDEYKFLEDRRYFKIKQFATGKATDNTCALYLDISNLAELYVTTKVIDVTPEA